MCEWDASFDGCFVGRSRSTSHSRAKDGHSDEPSEEAWGLCSCIRTQALLSIPQLVCIMMVHMREKQERKRERWKCCWWFIAKCVCVVQPVCEEQCRWICGEMHQQFGMPNNWSQEAEQWSQRLSHQHQMAQELLALGLDYLLINHS